MNKKDYMTNLLSLCTESQVLLFNRMYPNGPNPKQVKHAIFQLENTLKNLNKTNEDLRLAKKELATVTEEFDKKLSIVDKALRVMESELVDANDKIVRLSNPINIDNNDTQERLLLLDALQAGGVDNWEFYDISISEYNNGQ